MGCTSSPSIIKTQDRIVEIPVKIPCKIPAVEKPIMPFDEIKKEDDIYKKIKMALAEIELREAYEKKLEAAIKGCL
jgi:hypothetical protein